MDMYVGVTEKKAMVDCTEKTDRQTGEGAELL